MKHAEKNEVDLMLRGLARQQRAVPSQESLSAHLDVDEMSAYAEDALPAAARARYTSHLADCNDCRKLVASLATAAGAPARSSEVVATPARESLGQKLRQLFSPTVLRYAVPAVLLFAVITIGLLALRQQQEPGTVALRTDTQERAPESANFSDPQQPLIPVTTPSSTSGSSDAARTAQETEQSKSTETRQQPTPASAPAPVAGAGTGAGTVAAPPPPEPSYAKDPDEGKRASAAKPADSVSEETERQTRDERAREDNARARSENEKDKVATAREQGARVDRSATAPAQNQPMAGRAMRTQTLESKKEKGDEVETRTVAGRRFRRENNMWVDTAYGAGASFTNVRRGSDQFRALIADEPGLRTVSEQLGGTVIVVWKGRAYKIQ